MIERCKALLSKHREVIMYLIFGVLTTAVGFGVYYLVLLGGRAIFSIPAEDTSSTSYFALYTAAQLIQWVCAVLFAFFTNKKWVFTDADKAPLVRQLLTFSAGRLVTLGLDYVITLGLTFLLGALLPSLLSVFFLEKDWNLCEIAAKLVAAFVVVVSNYVIGKLMVFRKKKE